MGCRQERQGQGDDLAILAATPKFEAKRQGASHHSNGCIAVTLGGYSASNFEGSAFWGAAGCGEALAGGHGNRGFILPYTHNSETSSYIIVWNGTINGLYQTILLLSLGHVASFEPLQGRPHAFWSPPDNSRSFLLTAAYGNRKH